MATKILSSIKNKINLRKRLLKIDRLRSSNVNTSRIRSLSVELKSFFNGARASGVQRAAMGKKINLWKAVKVTKNLNTDSIPTNLTLGGCLLRRAELMSALVTIFHRKFQSMLA